MQDFQTPWLFRRAMSLLDAITTRMAGAEAALAADDVLLQGIQGNATALTTRVKAAEDAATTLSGRVGTAESTLGVVNGGPYNVQAGAANQLSTIPTTGLKPCIAIVADMGGCGSAGTNGPGLALWTGSEWRRLSRGVQATMTPQATINLDYWRDPWRVKLSGTTVATTNFLLVNSKVGHLVSIAKPGLTGALLAAFTVALSASPAAAVPVVGPTVAFIENDGSGVYAVTTS